MFQINNDILSFLEEKKPALAVKRVVKSIIAKLFAAKIEKWKQI